MGLYSKDHGTRLTSEYIINDIIILLKYIHEWTLRFVNIGSSTYKYELYWNSTSDRSGDVKSLWSTYIETRSLIDLKMLKVFDQFILKLDPDRSRDIKNLWSIYIETQPLIDFEMLKTFDRLILKLDL